MRLAGVSAACLVSVWAYGTASIFRQCSPFLAFLVGPSVVERRVPTGPSVRLAPVPAPDTGDPPFRVGFRLPPMAMADGRHAEKKGPP